MHVKVLYIALLVVCGFTTPIRAQRRYCSFNDWATSGSVPFRNHPSAHALGGIGLDLVARGPWFTKSFRDKPWKRVLIVTVLATAWEGEQLKETPHYPVKYALWDVGLTVITVVLMETLIK